MTGGRRGERVRRVVAILTAIGIASAVAACGGDDRATVTVFAAASLTDAFDDIADAFEDDHPGVVVERNFAGSSSLREQIVQGAPADVFASANRSTMEALLAAGSVEPSEDFATNRMAIAVPAGNPAAVRGLDDFARSELLLGLCAVEVPCGEFGRRVLSLASVDEAPDTEEPDVRALLTKIAAGELDAGIVYATDVLAAGDGIEGIEIPDLHNVVAAYPIAVVGDSDPDAESFVDFVLGPRGQEILSDHGFGPA